MAQEQTRVEPPWWELPRLPFRPQFLRLRYVLAERQPAAAARRVELALALLDG